MQQIALVDGGVSTDDQPQGRISKPWQAYLDAPLGFRNHWYPAVFSHELEEGALTGVQLLGERILLKRGGGTVYGVADRCAHRGTPFSTRPEAYTQNTVTCWYHGFTYDVRDGQLVAILTDPSSGLIGKLRLRTYPVEEQKGLVFVFVGDLTPPPPLALDLQPGFLDEELQVYPRGERQVVNSNWRLAAENGFDAAHIYIHRNSGLVEELRFALPLGTILYSREGMLVDREGAPKGVVKGSGQKTPVWESEIEGVRVGARYRPGEEGVTSIQPDTSMWLPCGLKVDPFPLPGIAQFEWYVPVDEHSHMYFMTWGQHADAGSATAFDDTFDERLKSLVVNQFNNDDVIAREGMEYFYAHEDGWHEEHLFRPDMIITEWRKLASQHNRGIQRTATVRVADASTSPS